MWILSAAGTQDSTLYVYLSAWSSSSAALLAFYTNLQWPSLSWQRLHSYHLSCQEQTGNDCPWWRFFPSLPWQRQAHSLGCEMSPGNMGVTRGDIFSKKSLLLDLLHHSCCLQSSNHPATESAWIVGQTYSPSPSCLMVLIQGNGRKDHLVFLPTNPIAQKSSKMPGRDILSIVRSLTWTQPAGMVCMVQGKRPWQKLKQAMDVQFEVACFDRSFELKNDEFKLEHWVQ